MSLYLPRFRRRLGVREMSDIIDFVIPWVDGSDPVWREKMERSLPDDVCPQERRYRDWGLLRYWFRAVERFAPWVGRIHFVSDKQCPDWLDTGHPKLRLVDHTDYIPPEWLPCFSSHPIELNMHRIPGLSSRFVYFNDDTFILRPIKPSLYFCGGLPRLVAALESRTPYDGGIYCYINNTVTLAAHFDIRLNVRKNPDIWLNPLRNGFRTSLRNHMYLKHFQYTNLSHNNHLPTPYLKDLLEKVWQEEPSLLERVSSHRFRQNDDVNQWLFHNWALMSGGFSPIKRGRLGQFHMISNPAGAGQAAEDVRRQKCSMICLNDDVANADEYEDSRRHLEEAFASILPRRSSFEKD